MADEEVHGVIERLVAEEARLLELEESGRAGADERDRLGAVRVELDRYWDLLRQRRAERAAGRDPDEASLRDGATVENYEQ